MVLHSYPSTITYGPIDTNSTIPNQLASQYLHHSMCLCHYLSSETFQLSRHMSKQDIIPLLRRKPCTRKHAAFEGLTMQLNVQCWKIERICTAKRPYFTIFLCIREKRRTLEGGMVDLKQKQKAATATVKSSPSSSAPSSLHQLQEIWCLVSNKEKG